jgi:hypothetical protein
MRLARRIILAITGVLGAAALVLGVATMHGAQPAHFYEGSAVVHAHIYGDVPAHFYEG